MLGFGFLYAWGIYKIEAMVQEVGVIEEEVRQINVQVDEAVRQMEILKEILPAQEILKKYFINRDNLVPFIEYIEDLAEKADVIIKLSNRQTSDSLNFTLSFDGEFNDCMYFIALIESLPYNLTIENVYVEQRSKGGLWGGGMNANLHGSGKD